MSVLEAPAHIILGAGGVIVAVERQQLPARDAFPQYALLELPALPPILQYQQDLHGV